MRCFCILGKITDFKLLTETLTKEAKKLIGVMYRPTEDKINPEIFVKTTDDSMVIILKKLFPNMIECAQPENFFDNKWNYLGNSELFTIKP